MSDERQTRSLLEWAGPVLGLFLVALVGIRTIAQARFWDHLVAGRKILESGLAGEETLSFLEPANAWIQGSWLYDILLVTLYRTGGSALVTLVHVALLLAALAVLIPAARRYGNGYAVGFALVLSAWLLTPASTVNPAVASLIFPALFCAVLSRPRVAWVYLVSLVPLQILWGSIHSSFLLGPILVTLVLFQARPGGRPPDAPPVGPLFKTAAILLVACLAATLIHPFGPGVYQWMTAQWSLPLDTTTLTGQSPFAFQFAFSSSSLVFYVALAISAGGLIAYKERLPMLFTGAAVLTAFLAMLTRQTPILFAVLAFPFITLSFTAVSQAVAKALRNKDQESAPMAGWIPVLLLVILVGASAANLISNRYYRGQATAARFGLGVETALFPDGAVALLQHEAFPERALNLAHDGGYLAWTCPERRIGLDTRMQVFGTEQYQEIAKALLSNETEAWAQLERDLEVEAVILNACHRNDSTVALNLILRHGYRLTWFDGTSLVLLKPTPANRVLSEDTALQAAGLALLEQSRQAYLQEAASGRAGLPPRLIGAASLFFQLQRYPEAESLYRTLTTVAPHMSNGWFNLGVAAFQNGHNEEALEAMENASRFMKDSALCWIWLHRLYDDAEKPAAAATALDQARKLDTVLADKLLEVWEKN